MRTSWCAEACAPIYVPMARGERSKLKTDLRREKGVWREKWRKMHGGARSGRQDWCGCTLVSRKKRKLIRPPVFPFRYSM
jgi:hypothetical protein